ncbi:MAG TPA: quinone-dependent dihydroorotate dehydrogenase [Chitinophagaceae bacterium]|nr:quinone-dependent dihydroorotate dehydrogenase [Chitinophagaceae bacterium]
MLLDDFLAAIYCLLLIFAAPMYQLLRSILFLLPAETAHYVAMNCLKAMCSVGFLHRLIRSYYDPSSEHLSQKVLGLHFKNPVGLGAGFDKNARYLRELKALGFGFVEIGTVTPEPQMGNERPRLFRLPADKALINRMGFNNEGIQVIAERLKTWKENERNAHVPSLVGSGLKEKASLLIGGNIGKNKVTPNEDAWKDYELCFHALHQYVDFFVVNVSSPNTPGLRELQEKAALKKILTHLQSLNRQYKESRPILLKIAPDLTEAQIDDVVQLAQEINLDGLVATNTTISRQGLVTGDEVTKGIGAGGLSGLPLKQRATEVIEYIHAKTGGSIPIIGSGGIANAMDAKEKFKAGAVLVEVWTGFIYEGPFIVKKICTSL